MKAVNPIRFQPKLRKMLKEKNFETAFSAKIRAGADTDVSNFRSFVDNDVLINVFVDKFLNSCQKKKQDTELKILKLEI